MVNTDFTIQTTYLYTQPITVNKLAVKPVLSPDIQSSSIFGPVTAELP